MTDMDDFKQTFFTECFELLNNIEEKLLTLNEHSSNEDLNAIFRCAHSIKGGAGTFGFEEIAHFTHALETMLDNLRSGKMKVTQAIVDLLLKSRDIMIEMVTTASKGHDVDKRLGSDILQQLKEMEGEKARAFSSTKMDVVASALPGVWQIDFAPHGELFMTGNDPLLIFRQLSVIGTILKNECDITKLPLLSKIDPHRCYLSWKITLETCGGEKAIREAFEFVEDNCDLTLTHISGSSGEEKVIVPAVEEEHMHSASPPGHIAEEKIPDAKSASKKGNNASIRVDIEKLDRLINMVGELVITQSMMHAQVKHLSYEEHSLLIQGIDALSQHTREIQEAVMSVRMQPVKSVFSRMPRIVRDLSQQLGRPFNFEVQQTAF